MKLSKETLNLFKNFSAINTNILITPGNKLATKSAKKTVAASASVSETFPIEFGIYDLSEFLGAIALFDSPDLEFNDKFVTISENKDQIKFYKASKEVLVYQERDVNFPETYIEFELPGAVLSNIQRTAGILHADCVNFTNQDGNLVVQVGKTKSEANSYYHTVGEANKNFKCTVLTEHFKMLPGDYIVSISSKKITRFKSKTSDLVYYLAVEASSTFE